MLTAATGAGLCSKLKCLYHGVFVRYYGHYPPGYEDPIVNFEELEKTEKDEDLNRHKSFVSVKAAKSSQSTSVFRDPLVRIQMKKYLASEDKNAVVVNPQVVLRKAVENCKPVLELKEIRRGGVIYNIPIPLTPKRAQFLAVKWIIESANEKEMKVSFCDKLASELVNACNNEGSVIRRKQDLHRKCEANRAFAHYRWR